MCASLIFPTDYLKGPMKTGRPKRPLLIFPSVPSGQAVVIGVFYSREDPNTLARAG